MIFISIGIISMEFISMAIMLHKKDRAFSAILYLKKFSFINPDPA